jgi:hypothetical protein
MKTKTFVVEFKSGRRDKFFAKDKSELNKMLNISLVKKIFEIK